ncbi:pseudouridine synthase [Marinicella sediminis]|uniref:Dual-specificity RNA pseudouridine synthase RluA n=1 Tax=Marinicella sediminis TaxID=1792834 RepID=A0ABV7J4K8_9GAMM|nr:pseudouridine synthase [Marinicella sediminis]
MKPYNPPKEPLLEIIHLDDDVLVLNKPPGLLSVPGRRPEHHDSLQSRAQQAHPSATTVHRLDMETSGLMVMAMNKASHVHLSRQFELRQVKKRYRARVFGRLPAPQGTVEAPLICDWPNRPRQMVDLKVGKPAVTHWQVLQEDAETSWVSLQPVTGRSHQLRVHMLHLGHPILGDSLYASGAALDMSDRLALQSEYLSFKAPGNEEPLSFQLDAEF